MRNDCEVNNPIINLSLSNINENLLEWKSAGVTNEYIDLRLPEILFITTYPPRECGIATYSKDLIEALDNKFSQSFNIKICALETGSMNSQYNDKVKYSLNTGDSSSYIKLMNNINNDDAIQMVVVQHEFGLYHKREADFKRFLKLLEKPVVVIFHTILPNPDEPLKLNIQEITHVTEAIVVMTNTSSRILVNEYEIPQKKITVIPHGTHLVAHLDKTRLKKKYGLKGKKVLATFGLLSRGKSIETTLEALPAIIEKNPETVFLILGKTHPCVVMEEGEGYREMLQAKVIELGLQEHVQFVNKFLSLTELLEYLQLTDIYLFTSKNPHQAVSGTFAYAMSCGCAIISTPIPHAVEFLSSNAGIIIDFQNAGQMSNAVSDLLNDEELRKNISANALHKIASTAWENSAIAHALLFERESNGHISLHYNIPAINLNHLKELTTKFGVIQFSKINKSSIESGYTLDDNARALITMCQHYKLTKNESDLKYVYTYFNFIRLCQQPDGNFLNYVSESKEFTEQNSLENLEDSNGRALWALGYLISLDSLLPEQLIIDADLVIRKTLQHVTTIYSTRAMAFAIKGLYYRNKKNPSAENTALITVLANRLIEMYRHESDDDWKWFESYLTYGNSIIPEAMLCAWLATKRNIYSDTAKSSFDFLLSKTFKKNKIKVVSNKGWMHKETISIAIGGEQPIDVAYTIIALAKFYNVFKEQEYIEKMEASFNWFLGNNHLQQVVYNPCTGGCYDGLEDNYINLNQGAESTVSYLMARLVIEKYLPSCSKVNQQKEYSYHISQQKEVV